MWDLKSINIKTEWYHLTNDYIIEVQKWENDTYYFYMMKKHDRYKLFMFGVNAEEIENNKINNIIESNYKEYIKQYEAI